jgi:hypothetical protein
MKLRVQSIGWGTQQKDTIGWGTQIFTVCFTVQKKNAESKTESKIMSKYNYPINYIYECKFRNL